MTAGIFASICTKHTFKPHAHPDSDNNFITRIVFFQIRNTIISNVKTKSYYDALTMKLFITILLFLGTASTSATSDIDAQKKFIWIEDVPFESFPSQNKEGLLRSLEGGDVVLAVQKACREKIGNRTFAEFGEVSDIVLTERKQKYSTTIRYIVNAKVAGYCVLEGWNSFKPEEQERYEAVPWCVEMKRGQVACAVNLPY